MPRGKKHGPEEVIPKLREAEVLISQGSTQELAAKQIGVYETDADPLAEGIRRFPHGPGETDEAAGEGECQAQESCWPKPSWIRPS